MSDVSAFNDPYAQPGRGQPGKLTDVSPPGYQIQFDEKGGAFAIPPDQGGPEKSLQQTDHFDNLAEVMDETDLSDICTDLLEAIDDDKESRADRDKQYEQGLNRTGMGSNVPGGANFPGASRAIHPMLLESSIDFGGAMMNEMMPPEGPCRTQIQGDENDQKDEKARKCARWINYQFTEVMPSAFHEFDIGFTQCPLGGGFYTKTYVDDVGNPAIAFIPIDHVYRPYSDGDFYSQPRITHNMTVDKWTYRQNVESKLWRDVVAYDVRGGNIPEETLSDEAANRQIGKQQPGKNIDAYRPVYETSTLLQLPGDPKLMPYLVTLDVEAREVLAIYRNWRQNDDDAGRCIFLIEWPFWPWRGGYPVGLTHMIGSLSGAATGSLRALLDSAMLNTSQTGMRLKGGSSAGGQNMTPRVTEIAEVQGSLAQDDIRKAFLPIQFSPPSPTLLQLLSFLVDAGRGVVRSTYDEMDKFGANTPVGTTQMFLEQGLRNLGAVHRRMHRSMRLLLKGIWQINADTLTDATVIDAHGELTVSAADFQGPMSVLPVSDPKLWSDLQRKALAQTVVTRASDPVAGQLYNTRATESYFLKQMGASNPDQFLKANPQPQRTNAVAENVAASTGQPIKAFPGQDHEAHIQVHVAYLKSPFFGQNYSLAVKFIPQIIDHLGEHLALWYSDAMLEAATQALRRITGNNFITLESFMGEGTEAGLDRLMSELDDDVLELAQESLKEVPAVVEEARQLLKTMAPPTPMDPSLVAQEDIQRQRQKDDADTKAKVIDLQIKQQKGESDAQFKERQLRLQEQKDARDAQLKADQLEAQKTKDLHAAAISESQMNLDAQQSQDELAADWDVKQADIAARDDRNSDDNDTAIRVTEMKNESAEKTAEMAAKAAKAKGLAQAKARKGRGNLTTGTGQGGGDSG